MKLHFAIYEAGKPRNARRGRILGAVSAVLLTTASYAASVAVDVGNMKVTTYRAAAQDRTVLAGARDALLRQANLKGAQDEAAKVGATVNVFDGKADPMN